MQAIYNKHIIINSCDSTDNFTFVYISQLILYKKIIAVCSEINTMHMNLHVGST
jgi:hypothetical protein